MRRQTPVRGTAVDQPARPGTKRLYLLAGSLSLGIHLVVLLAIISSRTTGPMLIPPSAEEPEAIVVTLVQPPPPRPAPTPEPAPGPPVDSSPAAGPEAARPDPSPAPPVPARPAPARTAPRPRPAVAPPPQVETLRIREAPAVGPMASLGDSDLAGATVAGSGAGTGSGGGAGGTGGGGGGGGGGCDMVHRLQEALRADPEVRAAVVQAHRTIGSGRALLIWNGDWIQNPGQEGKGLAGLRQAIAAEVAFSPQACRAQTMRGLVLISFSDAPGGARLVLGTGSWRWTELTGGRR